MKTFEMFIEENPQITKNPYEVFEAYSAWLQKSYALCPSEAGRQLLQEEADRFSDIYVEAIKKLFN